MTERVFVDCLDALLALTELEREAWIDHHILGWRPGDLARRDGVHPSAITRRLERADRKVAAVASCPVDQRVAA